jgi:hypothetical protein
LQQPQAVGLCKCGFKNRIEMKFAKFDAFHISCIILNMSGREGRGEKEQKNIGKK